MNPNLAETWRSEAVRDLRQRATNARTAAEHLDPGPYRRTIETSAEAWERAAIALDDYWREALHPPEPPVLLEDATIHEGTALVSLKVWQGVSTAARIDLRTSANRLAGSLRYQDIDVHIEAYQLRKDTADILRRSS